MHLTILGSGTCASAFAPGRDCDRSPPAFLVELGAQRLLLDCSEGVRLRLEQAGVDYSSIDHVTLTHAHPDHCAIFHFIQSQLCKGLWGGEKFINEKLHIYCPDQIANEFDNAWNFYFPDYRGERYPYPIPVLHPMSGASTRVQPIGPFELKSFSMYHGRGRVDALGYRVTANDRVLAYSGDTGDCESAYEVCRNADLFICECNARPGEEEKAKAYGHLTPFQAGTICRESGVKRVILVHYTGLDDDEVLLEDCRRSGFQGDIVIGKDFQKFDL